MCSYVVKVMAEKQIMADFRERERERERAIDFITKLYVANLYSCDGTSVVTS
jgi:hypothetical protein